MDVGDLARGGVCGVDLVVLAARRPQDGPPLRVVQDPQGELAVVVVDLAHPCGRVKVDGEEVSVVGLTDEQLRRISGK